MPAEGDGTSRTGGFRKRTILGISVGWPVLSLIVAAIGSIAAYEYKKVGDEVCSLIHWLCVDQVGLSTLRDNYALGEAVEITLKIGLQRDPPDKSFHAAPTCRARMLP